MKRRSICSTWAWKITCQHFNWMVQLSSGWKWRSVKQTLLFTGTHYWGPRFSVLHLGLSAPLRVSSGCAGPPSPVLCHGPALCGLLPVDGVGVLPHMQPTSPSSSSHRNLGVPSVSTPLSVWSPQCRTWLQCRGYDIPHWIAVYCGAERQHAPFPWHTTQEKRGWQPRCLGLQEAHAHGLVSPLRVPSADPCEERGGEMYPQRVRGINTQDNLQKDLTTLLESSSKMDTLQTLSATLWSQPHRKQQTQAAWMIDRRRRRDHWYVAGISEDIRHACMKFKIRVVFKSGWTGLSAQCWPRSKIHFWQPIQCGTLYPMWYVHHIPCSYVQIYIRETKRRLETRLKEHWDACERKTMDKSAVAEHAWENYHQIHWEEYWTMAEDRSCWWRYIKMTLSEKHFNPDGGLEVLVAGLLW